MIKDKLDSMNTGKQPSCNNSRDMAETKMAEIRLSVE